jgi:oxygen-dependent protoporphyrinogen oxidase
MPGEVAPYDAELVVIGGGIGGLATAWYAAQRHPEWRIVVVEASARTGGVIETVERSGCTLECGPDSIVSAKPAGLALIKALGLEDRIQGTDPASRSACIARGARLITVPEGLYLMAPGRWLPFLRSPLLSWPGKLRMGLDLLLPRGGAAAERDANGQPAPLDETLGSFVRRRLGDEALERIAQPMISGIYTADPERLSLAATMPQFLAMERSHRSLLLAMRQRSREMAASGGASGPRYGLFITLKGGLEVLVRTLRERLVAQGVAFRCGTPVAGVRRLNDAPGLHIASECGGLRSRRAAICTPAFIAAALVRDLDAPLSEQLAGIPYAGVATVNLSWRQDQVPPMPMAAGFVVPAKEGRSLVAATFANRKYLGRCPPDRVVLRAFVGGALHAHHLERDDATVVAGLRADLADLLKIHAEPEDVLVRRYPRAMAQYHLGHLDRVRTIRQRERDLPIALVGNGYEGVGIPDLIAQAEQAVGRMG